MTRNRQLEMEWSEEEGRRCLRVHGWTWRELQELSGLDAVELGGRLAVLPSQLVQDRSNLRAIQPIAGRFKIDQNGICFVPRFPFLEGMHYSLLVGSASEEANGDCLEVWTMQCPGAEGVPTADVVGIYPSAGHLPVNQLKLYVQFSSSMSEGCAARAVHVHRTDNGELLEDVFLSMEPELWDREHRRLTLLLDPGRIKRGLVPNAEAGYPLIEGVPVIVTISPEFRDAAGQPLRAGAEQRYEVGPPLRIRVDPSGWTTRCPAAGSMDPLTVEFDRPLDYGLLQHSLWVNDAGGAALAGQSSVGPDERCWRFQPQVPWKADPYQVTVDPRLEDLAGNSLMRVFDRDLMRAEDAPSEGRNFAIGFSCLPAQLLS